MIPTNQYEADEKFDLEADKLEERIQKRIMTIYENPDLCKESINLYFNHEINIEKGENFIETISNIIRYVAEQDVKNGDD